MAREMTPAEIADLLKQNSWFAEHNLLDSTLFELPDDFEIPDNKTDKEQISTA